MQKNMHHSAMKKNYATQCMVKKKLYEALSAHFSLVSLGWQSVAGAGCTG